MSTSLRALAARFLSDRKGATAIEYALLGSLIAVVVVMSIRTLGTNLEGLYTSVSSAISR